MTGFYKMATLAFNELIKLNSAILQIDRISKLVLKKKTKKQRNKALQIFREKTNILLHPDTHTHVRNVRFSENLVCFVFMQHPFCDSPFCLIIDKFSVEHLRKVSFKLNYSFPGSRKRQLMITPSCLLFSIVNNLIITMGNMKFECLRMNILP